MELKITHAQEEGNYIITEVVESTDINGNVIQIAGESGQHTKQSVIDNILTRNAQIEAIELEIEKWQTYLDAIENFEHDVI